jgi:signal transduction histidine kinase
LDAFLATSLECFQRRLTALKDADHRKNEFLAMLGHELRNPLTPISTAVEILSAPELDKTTLVRVRDLLARNVAHMSRLVNDLLDVSRITRGLINVELKPVELSAILKEVLITLSLCFNPKNKHLICNCLK